MNQIKFLNLLIYQLVKPQKSALFKKGVVNAGEKNLHEKN
jgi:hypothetical protein